MMRSTMGWYRCAIAFACIVGIGASAATAQIDWDSLPYTPHSTLQAVNPDGSPAYLGGFPLRVQGVLLNTPGTIFDNTPQFVPVNWPQTAFQFGARQQPYVQSVAPNDVGGTAMFLAQSLGNHPANQDDEFSYTDAEWLLELARVNFDPATGHEFQAGDLVEVRARIGLHFSGKFNINEAHDNAPLNDFDVILLEAGYGLPAPQVITLADVKTAADEDIFDPTRATGGERYQSQRVKLRNVTILDPENWAAETQLLVTDGTRTLPLLLGTDPDFDTLSAPAGPVDVLGIFDQEASPAPFGGLNGYRMMITAAADITPAETCAADLDGNLQTDFADFQALVGVWPSSDPAADLNGDGLVDLRDFALLQEEFGCGGA